MRSLKDLALEEALKKLSLEEAVNKLRSDEDLYQTQEDYLHSRQGVLKLVDLCSDRDRSLQLHVDGRLDLETREEWLEYVTNLSRGIVWEYGYKYVRLVVRRDTWFQDTRKKDDDDEYIVVYPAPYDDPDEDYHLTNPGLPLGPIANLRGANIYRTTIRGTLPKIGTIGVHMEAKIAFLKFCEEDYSNEEYFDCLCGGEKIRHIRSISHNHVERGKISRLFFMKDELRDNEKCNEKTQYMYLALAKSAENFVMGLVDADVVPEHCTYQCWDAEGCWDDKYSMNIEPEPEGSMSWKNYEMVVPLLLSVKSGDKVAFSNPGLEHGVKDWHEITVMMSDRKSLFQIGFNCTKIYRSW